MSAVSEIKKKFHTLIDEIENEQLLQAAFGQLKENSSNEVGFLWSQLSHSDKEELEELAKRSTNPKHLKDHTEVTELFNEWKKNH